MFKAFKKIRLLSSVFILSAGLFLFTGCQTTFKLKGNYVTNPEVYPESSLCPPVIEWEPLQEGFEITSYKIRSLGVSWHCVKIDLDNPKLHVHIEPHKNNIGSIFKVKDFARATKSVAAINTTPFELPNKTYVPVGIIKINGEEITPPVERYCAFVLSKNEDNHFRAGIIDRQTQGAFDDYLYAVGGFFTIYKDNQIISFHKGKRSRSGCGISHDGRYLYLMTVTPFFHPTDRNGLNYEECAIIFRKLGCTKAMQFDGGHSCALVVNGKQVESTFMQRKVPIALGFSVED